MRNVVLSLVILMGSVAVAHAQSTKGQAARGPAHEKRAGALLNKSKRVRNAAHRLLAKHNVAANVWSEAHPEPQPPQGRGGKGPAIRDVEVVGYKRGKMTVKATVMMMELLGPAPGHAPVTRTVEVSGAELTELRELLKQEPREPSKGGGGLVIR